MTTTCDLNVDWNRCAYCSELRDRVQSASDLRLACSQRLDQAWEEYRAERERGNVAFGTVTHRAWQARIDNLDRQLLAADAAAGEAIDEWADCIHEHHRSYEARQQEGGDGEACADGMHEHMDDVDDVDEACTGDIGDTDGACPDLGGYADPRAWCRCGERRGHDRGGYVHGDDAPERARRREELRRLVGKLMGVDPDEVNIICSGVFEIGGDRDGHA